MNSREFLRSPLGHLDPHELFFYVHSSGNEDLDHLTLQHEILGHAAGSGLGGIDSMISLALLKGGPDWIGQNPQMKLVLEAKADYFEKKQIEKGKAGSIHEPLYRLLSTEESLQLQAIQRRISSIAEEIKSKTEVAFPIDEIYSLSLHYWKKGSCDPIYTLDVIQKTIPKLRGKSPADISLDLRKHLLHKGFQLLGCLGTRHVLREGKYIFPLELIPFLPATMMSYRLMNEPDSLKRRVIFAHLLNSLTDCACRGIFLPFDVLGRDKLTAMEFSMSSIKKTWDVDVKVPFNVFWPPLSIFAFMNSDPGLDTYENLYYDLGFRNLLAREAIRFEVPSDSSWRSQALRTLKSLCLVHVACDLINAYMLTCSISPFWRNGTKMSVQAGPSSVTIGIRATSFFTDAVSSLEPHGKDLLNRVMTSFIGGDRFVDQIKSVVYSGTATDTENLRDELSNVPANTTSLGI